MASFYAQEDGYAAFGVGFADVGGCGGQDEIGRLTLYLAMDRFDLFEGALYGWGPGYCAGSPDGEEYGGYAALA
jgi:hypothetical protein